MSCLTPVSTVVSILWSSLSSSEILGSDTLQTELFWFEFMMVQSSPLPPWPSPPRNPSSLTLAYLPSSPGSPDRFGRPVSPMSAAASAAHAMLLTLCLLRPKCPIARKSDKTLTNVVQCTMCTKSLVNSQIMWVLWYVQYWVYAPPPPSFNMKVMLLYFFPLLLILFSPCPPVLYTFEGQCCLTTMTRSAPNSFHWEEIARQGQIPNDLYCEKIFNESTSTIWPSAGLSQGVVKGKVTPRATCIRASVTTFNEGVETESLGEKCGYYDINSMCAIPFTKCHKYAKELQYFTSIRSGGAHDHLCSDPGSNILWAFW